MGSSTERKEPERTVEPHILNAISSYAIRYLEAMVGCYVRIGNIQNASRIKRIIRELRTILATEKINDKNSS